MNIGDNIKRLRKRKGLTQSELGKKLGVTQSAIGQFEKGTSSIKVETIEKIAKALDVPVSSLLAGVEINHNKLSKNTSKTAKDITKRLALVKLLDCIYDSANITKVKICDKETQEIIYNQEYVSIAANYSCGSSAIDTNIIDALLNIIESICQNIIPLNEQNEDEYIYQNYSQKDKKFSYEFFDEILTITTETKPKYKKLNSNEWEQMVSQVQNKINKNSNKEEFQPIISENLFK